MARLTITLSDERHRQLKMRAAYENTTIGTLIEEALRDAEHQQRRNALEMLEKARRNAARATAGMSDEDIEQWAVREVRTYRNEQAAERSSHRAGRS